jgi:release factor glutamine methyltransferase
MSRLTVGKLLKETKHHPDAMVLLGAVLKKTRAQLWTHPELVISQVQEQRFRKYVKRRTAGEPFAYILGEREFYKLKFYVAAGVLIPRPESELIIEEALRLTPQGAQLVDLGTGSGCLGVTMAVLRPDLRVTAIDPSKRALRVARKNVILHNVARKITLRKGTLSILRARPPRTSWVLLANLPYLTTREAAHKDLRREPRLALDGGDDGLKIFRSSLRVLEKLPLAPSVSIWEIDPRRVRQTAALLRRALPNQHCDVLHDLAGRARVIRCSQ